MDYRLKFLKFILPSILLGFAINIHVSSKKLDTREKYVDDGTMYYVYCTYAFYVAYMIYIVLEQLTNDDYSSNRVIRYMYFIAMVYPFLMMFAMVKMGFIDNYISISANNKYNMVVLYLVFNILLLFACGMHFMLRDSKHTTKDNILLLCGVYLLFILFLKTWNIHVGNYDTPSIPIHNLMLIPVFPINMKANDSTDIIWEKMDNITIQSIEYEKDAIYKYITLESNTKFGDITNSTTIKFNNRLYNPIQEDDIPNYINVKTNSKPFSFYILTTNSKNSTSFEYTNEKIDVSNSMNETDPKNLPGFYTSDNTFSIISDDGEPNKLTWKSGPSESNPKPSVGSSVVLINGTKMSPKFSVQQISGNEYTFDASIVPYLNSLDKKPSQFGYAINSNSIVSFDTPSYESLLKFTDTMSWICQWTAMLVFSYLAYKPFQNLLNSPLNKK